MPFPRGRRPTTGSLIRVASSFSFSRRSGTLWVAALLLAVSTAAVVASDLARLHRRASDLGSERSVTVAAHDLPLGHSVTADDVAVVRRHTSQVTEGAFADVEEVIGSTIAVPVVEGSVLVGAHVVEADRDWRSIVVPDGMRVMRVPDPSGLGPHPGDLVDVIVALDALAADSLPTAVPVRAARVLPAREEPSRSSPIGGTPAAVDGDVLLLVPADDAERLAFAVATGTITLALAPPEDACCATSSSASSRG